MYPAMCKALLDLGTKRKTDGVIKYTPTVGTDNARNAFLNILSAEGYDETGIFSMVTDGGSSAMELMLGENYSVTSYRLRKTRGILL